MGGLLQESGEEARWSRSCYEHCEFLQDALQPGDLRAQLGHEPGPGQLQSQTGDSEAESWVGNRLNRCSTRIDDIHKFLVLINRGVVDDLARTFASVSDSQQYDLVQRTEKLYMRLMIEYNQELHRAHSLGLFKQGPESSAKAGAANADIAQPLSQFDSHPNAAPN